MYALFLVSVLGFAMQAPTLPPCGYNVYPCFDIYTGAIHYRGEAQQAQAEKQANERQWLDAYRVARSLKCHLPRITKGMNKRQKFRIELQRSSLALMPAGERQKLDYLCGW
jgi:hypothetical protein